MGISGFSPESLSLVEKMLEFSSVDWERQFDTGKGGPNNPKNYEDKGTLGKSMPSLADLDIDMRNGKQPGNQGKLKVNSDAELLAPVAYPKGPGNPQGGSSKEVFGLRAFSEVHDFTRCVRPNGTAYGTSGNCRKGSEQQKEYPYEAAVTQGRFNIPHSGHAKLIKGMLKKAPVVHVIMGKGKENVDKDFRSQMLRAVLRKEGVDLSRVKLIQGSTAGKVLEDLSQKSGKDKVLFMLGADQEKFLNSMGKALGVKTAKIPRDETGSSSSAIRKMIDEKDFEGLRKEFGNSPYLTRLAQVARKVEKDEFSED